MRRRQARRLNKRVPRVGLVVLAIVMVSMTAACSSMKLGVEPWERDILAKRSMDPKATSLDDGLDDHIYFSREASSGGRAFAGGGCGCN